MFQSKVLPNGITVIMEHIPHVRSIACGVWFKNGSRHELIHQAGFTHLCEHMLFKGSKKKDAKKLAVDMDVLGGHFDAGTSREFLFVFSKFLDEYLPEAFDIITELILSPEFKASEVEKEIKVVLEEIGMFLDDPEDQVLEMMYDLCWNGSSLSLPILGSPAVIGRVQRDQLVQFYNDFLQPRNLLLVFTGNINANKLLEKVNSCFGTLDNGTCRTPQKTPAFIPAIRRIPRDLEQTYFALGLPWLSVNHEQRYFGYLANTILGGNMSSLLFQKLREDNGLTYNIGSFDVSYSDTGLLVISGATKTGSLKHSLNLILDCIEHMADCNISHGDLETAKTSLKNGLALGFEGSAQRMSILAKQFAYIGRRITLTESLKEIENISLDQFNSFCKQWLKHDQKSLVLYGPGQVEERIDQSFQRELIKNF